MNDGGGVYGILTNSGNIRTKHVRLEETKFSRLSGSSNYKLDTIGTRRWDGEVHVTSVDNQQSETKSDEGMLLQSLHSVKRRPRTRSVD